MRQELLHLGPYTFINDTYNANPASMAEAIRTLDLLTKGRKIAVLGGMGELGDWAKDEHRAIGRLVADMKLDASLPWVIWPTILLWQPGKRHGSRLYDDDP